MKMTEICLHDTRNTGMEEGIVEAYITDEVDTWGKRTILISHDDGVGFLRYYLFPDEWERMV